MVKIRAFEPDDASAVSAVIRRTMRVSNSGDYPLDRLQLLIDYFSPEKVLQLSEERHCLVAETGGRVIGTIAIDETELCTFFVRPDCQGQGIGTRLLSAIETIAVAKGLEQLNMHASLTAVPFYERLGYRKTGDDIDGTAGLQIGMRKGLNR